MNKVSVNGQYTSENNSKSGWNREGIMTVAGGTVLMFILGAFYLWGTIGIYVTSYLRQFEPDLTIGTTSVLFPLQGIVIAIGWPLGKVVQKYIRLRIIVIICMIFICGSYLLQSFVKAFWLYAFLYAVVTGFFTGVVYFPPILTGWKHLPTRKGSVTGIVVAGFAIGSFIFGIITEKIVNPDDISPTHKGTDGQNYYIEEEILNRVPMMLRVLAGSYAVLAVIGIFLLQDVRDPEESESHVRLIDDESDISRSPEEPVMTFKEAFKTKQLYMLTFMVFGSSIIGFFMASSFKLYGQKQPALNDSLFLAWVGGVANIWNGGSRIMWGYLLDRIGFKKVYGGLVIVEIIVGCTLQFASHYRWMYFTWVSILLCCEGGHFALFPTETSRVFGPELGPRVYALVGFGLTFGNLAQFFVGKYIITNNYVVLIYTYAAIAIMAFIMMLFFKEELDKKNTKTPWYK